MYLKDWQVKYCPLAELWCGVNRLVQILGGGDILTLWPPAPVKVKVVCIDLTKQFPWARLKKALTGYFSCQSQTMFTYIRHLQSWFIIQFPLNGFKQTELRTFLYVICGDWHLLTVVRLLMFTLDQHQNCKRQTESTVEGQHHQQQQQHNNNNNNNP